MKKHCLPCGLSCPLAFFNNKYILNLASPEKANSLVFFMLVSQMHDVKMRETLSTFVYTVPRLAFPGRLTCKMWNKGTTTDTPLVIFSWLVKNLEVIFSSKRDGPDEKPVLLSFDLWKLCLVLWMVKKKKKKKKKKTTTTKTTKKPCAFHMCKHIVHLSWQVCTYLQARGSRAWIRLLVRSKGVARLWNFANR